MSRDIVAISQHDDPHVPLIRAAAEARGIAFSHLSLGLGPDRYSVRSVNFSVAVVQGESIYCEKSLENSDVLYLPMAVNRPPWVVVPEKLFAVREWNATIESALLQWWTASGKSWLIGPHAPVLQDRKLFLLNVAQHHSPDILIPITQVGTHFDAIQTKSELVGKAVNAWQEVRSGRYFNTTILTTGQVAELIKKGNRTPIVVQEFLPHSKELRVYFARGQLCAVEIELKSHRLADFRLLDGSTGSAHFLEGPLPAGIASALGRLCAQLELEYCCFDFIVDPNSEALFLTDVNPTGTWRYLLRDFEVDVTGFILDNLGKE